MSVFDMCIANNIKIQNDVKPHTKYFWLTHECVLIFQTGSSLTCHKQSHLSFSYMFNQLLGYWGHTSVLVFSLRLWLAVIDDASTAQRSSLFLSFPLSLSVFLSLPHTFQCKPAGIYLVYQKYCKFLKKMGGWYAKQFLKPAFFSRNKRCAD